MKHAWTIYNPVAPIKDLRLFKTKKEAQAEWDRIYAGAIGDLIKDLAPNSAIIIKVDLHTPPNH